MEPFFSLSTLKAVLAAVSTLFGIIGVITEPRHKGRLTRFATLAIAGIVITNAFSAWVDRRKDQDDDNRARVQRDTEAARYKNQIASLYGLSTSMSHSLIEQRQQSAEQRRQLDLEHIVADESARTVNLSLRAGTQQTHNAESLMYVLRDQLVHVSDNSIRLVVTGFCYGPSSTENSKAIPRLFAAGSVAQIGLFGWPTEPGSITLDTQTQDYRPEYTPGDNDFQTYIFTGFSGSLGRFSSLDGWRQNAQIYIHLLSRHPGLASIVTTLMGGSLRGREAMPPGNDIIWGASIEPDDKIVVLPCTLSAELRVQDYVVAVEEGVLVEDLQPGKRNGVIAGIIGPFAINPGSIPENVVRSVK